MRKISDKIFKTNTGNYSYKVIARENKVYTLMFLDGPKAGEFTIKEKAFSNIHAGNIKHPFHPYVCGVGYLGLTKHIDKSIYKYWYEMLRRCYGNRNKAYENVEVSDDFKCFDTFQKWAKSNLVEGNNIELDKDLLTYGLYKNNLYDKDRCLFIPKVINNAIKRRDNDRGDCVIGVQKLSENSYKARVSVCGERIQVYLKTELDAFIMYRKLKQMTLSLLEYNYSEQLTNKAENAMLTYKFIDETNKFTEEFIETHIGNETNYIEKLGIDILPIGVKINKIIQKFKSDEMCVQRLSKAK